MNPKNNLRPKLRPLGNTAYDDATCAQFIESDAEGRFLVLGNGYYDSADFDQDAIVKAYQEVVRRNDAFRMRIVGKLLWPRYYIQEYTEPRVYFHTLEGGREAFQAECTPFAKPDIKITDADLCQADVYSCSDGTGGIIIWQHHICSDGYTLLPIIYQQLCEFYQAYKSGNKPAPAARLFSYNDYIDRRRAYLKKHGFHDFFVTLRDSWKYLFRYTIPVNNALTIKPQIEQRFLIDTEEYAQLTELCRKLNCPMPAVMNACFAMMVEYYTGKNYFKIDVMSHGRSNSAFKNTAGCLANTISMIMDVNKKYTADEIIKNTYKLYHKNNSLVSFPALLTSSTIEAVLCLASLKLPWKNRWCEINYYKSWYQDDVLESFAIEEQLNFMAVYLEFHESTNGISVLFRHAEMFMDEPHGAEAVRLFHRLLKEICKNSERPLQEILLILQGAIEICNPIE